MEKYGTCTHEHRLYFQLCINVFRGHECQLDEVDHTCKWRHVSWNEHLEFYIDYWEKNGLVLKSGTDMNIRLHLSILY